MCELREKAIESYIVCCMIGVEPSELVYECLKEMVISDVKKEKLINFFHIIKGGDFRSKILQVEVAFMAEIECHETVLEFSLQRNEEQ